jgi:ubiquitin carboxyl-terminal hydrolase 34
MVGSFTHSCIDVPRSIWRRLFWKHLFPPFEDAEEQFVATGDGMRPILHEPSRKMLIDVLSSLATRDLGQLGHLVEDLDTLVPYYFSEDGSSSRTP